MNILKTKLYHKTLSFPNENDIIEFEIDNIRVYLKIAGENLTITLKSRKKYNNLKKTFYLIFDYLFIIIGSYPLIVYQKYNDEDVDLNDHSSKFTTSDNYYKNNTFLLEISSETINKDFLEYFKKVDNEIISLLAFITSRAYKNVIFYHKIVLLLHIVDGISSTDSNIQANIRNDFNIKKSDHIKYHDILRYVSKPFFKIHRNYNLGLMKKFRLTKEKYFKVLKDTRHAHSHIMIKPDNMKDPTEMYAHFEILYILLRVFIIEHYILSNSRSNVSFSKKGLDLYKVSFNSWADQYF